MSDWYDKHWYTSNVIALHAGNYRLDNHGLRLLHIIIRRRRNGSGTSKEEMKLKTSEQLLKWRWSGSAIEEDRSCGGTIVRRDLKAWSIREEWATDRERWKGPCKTPYSAQGDGGERWQCNKCSVTSQILDELSRSVMRYWPTEWHWGPRLSWSAECSLSSRVHLPQSRLASPCVALKQETRDQTGHSTLESGTIITQTLFIRIPTTGGVPALL